MSVGFFRLPSVAYPDFLAAIRAHYPDSAATPPGKRIAWRIFESGRHIGYIAIGEPSFKLAARRRLGLADARPLPRTVCCFIYRLESPSDAMASEILDAWHPVASAEWKAEYGWAPEHWETLVDPAEVKSPVAGACFREAGYRSLGMTTGRGARRPAGHGHGARIWGETSQKVVLYRGPLHRVDMAQVARLAAAPKAIS